MNVFALTGLREALVSPGPDLVICDEGHRIKNSHASISQSLKNIKTRFVNHLLTHHIPMYMCLNITCV